MQLFPASPERNNETGLYQYAEVFGDTLAGHAEVPAELTKSLPVILVELIEQGAAAGIGEGFKNIIHCKGNTQPNGCILFT